MTTRTTIGILVALAFVVFAITLFFSIRGGEEVQDITEPELQGEETAYVPDVINALHEYRDGVHTIAGAVDVPTPCDLLEVEPIAQVREPDPDRAVLQFNTINEAEMCAQVITEARFKTSFSASEDAEMTATWNGQPVRLNVVDVAPGESLDNFDEYFKG